MNKATHIGFADEIQKSGRLMPLTRLSGVAKRFFAGRKGAKDIYKKVSNEAAALRKSDPTADIKAFMKSRTTQLKSQGKAKASKAAENALAKGSNIKGQSIISRNKGKILLGGAVGGGLIYANAANNKKEEQRKQLAGRRNLRIPRRVYYQ